MSICLFKFEFTADAKDAEDLSPSVCYMYYCMIYANVHVMYMYE